MTWFIYLINENLLPNEVESEVISITESFIKAAHEEHKSVNLNKAIIYEDFKKVIYGLCSICLNKKELSNNINKYIYNRTCENIKEDINFLKNEYNDALIFLDRMDFYYYLKTEELIKILYDNYNFNTETGGFNFKIKKDNIETKISNLAENLVETFPGALSDNFQEAEKKLLKLNEIINSPHSKNKLVAYSIKNKLDKNYFGNEEIKKEISRIFYEHLYKINNKKNNNLPKRNVLITGPSGSGKTYIIELAAKILDIPFISYDVTKLSRTGLVGEKVNDILSLLFLRTGKIEMEYGIVFLDEIDKLAANLQYGNNSYCSTEVQYDLLKFIEGSSYSINFDKYRNLEIDPVDIDTSNLLIICGGAFTGIDKFIEKRIKKNNFGFNQLNDSENSHNTSVSIEDLISYGLIKEFAARFQNILSLPERNMDELYNILVNSEDSVLKSYIEYFNNHNCILSFEESALKQIAEYAFNLKIGARGLVSILDKVLPMYEIITDDIKEFTLTKEIVNKKLKIY